MKIGSKVRLKGVPPSPPDPPDLPTKATFARCLGHDFTVAGFNELGVADLVIESVTRNAGETIWVESEFLEIVS